MKTLLFLALALTLRAQDVNVTLAWNANPEPDIAKYVLKIGTAAGAYPYVTDVSGITKTVALPKDTLHFAIVCAVNTSGLESPPSAVLVFQVFAPGQGKVPSQPVGLSKPAALQASLETSTDLIAWQVVATKDLPPLPRVFVRAAIAAK